MPLANFLRIGTQSREITAVLAGNHKSMRHTARVKTEFIEVRAFKRMVDELVVIGRDVTPKAPRVNGFRRH